MVYDYSSLFIFGNNENLKLEHADRKSLDPVDEVLGAPHVPGRHPWKLTR